MTFLCEREKISSLKYEQVALKLFVLKGQGVQDVQFCMIFYLLLFEVKIYVIYKNGIVLNYKITVIEGLKICEL
jgi:hypothetical protein